MPSKSAPNFPRFISSSPVMKIAAGALILALSGTSSSAMTPLPQGQEIPAANISSTQTSTMPEMTSLTGKEAKAAADRAMSQLDSSNTTIHAQRSDLDLEAIKVNSVKANGMTMIAVTIPLKGEYTTTSNVTFLQDSQGKPLAYSETAVTRGKTGNFHITKYSQGREVDSRDTGIPYMTNSELAKDAKNPTDSGMVRSKGTGEIVACLGVALGISGVVGRIIVVACAGACVAGETGVTIPVCVACIGAYAAVGTGSLSAATGCFN